MKVVITKEEFDKLDDAFKAVYKETDGSYVLQAEGIDDHPDVKALKGAFEAVKGKKTEAAKRLEELEAAKKAADEATLVEQQKFKELSELKAKEAADSSAELEALKAEILKSKVDSMALEIATEINKDDSRRQRSLVHEIKPLIKNTENGLALLNPDGTPTDKKTVIANLTKEFPFLASGNPASGGDAQGNQATKAHTEPPKTVGEAVKAAFSGVTQ